MLKSERVHGGQVRVVQRLCIWPPTFCVNTRVGLSRGVMLDSVPVTITDDQTPAETRP